MSFENPTEEIHRGLLYEEDGRTDPDPDDERLNVFREVVACNEPRQGGLRRAGLPRTAVAQPRLSLRIAVR